jgi:hypothetical protein
LEDRYKSFFSSFSSRGEIALLAHGLLAHLDAMGKEKRVPASASNVWKSASNVTTTQTLLRGQV